MKEEYKKEKKKKKKKGRGIDLLFIYNSYWFSALP
jgi:hypothetical protein